MTTPNSFNFSLPNASGATSSTTSTPGFSSFSFNCSKAPSAPSTLTTTGTTLPTLNLSTTKGQPSGFTSAGPQPPGPQPPGPGLPLGSSLSTGAVPKASTGLSSLANPALGTSSAPALKLTNTGASTALKHTLGTAPTAAPTSTTGSTTASTTASATGTSAPKMTYKELEEQMNKWYMELDHQEKVFLEQATKVNAWDKVLIENGQKITDLNSDVEKIKLDQHRLTHELDFILAQQKELEEMLVPLEESVVKLPPINYQQHTDSEREHTYQIAENIDAQLKRMTEDLKEVIDHLNTGAGSQDTADPMLQISKILNAHMESLQWVDQNAAVLQRKTAEVTRYADITKKEHERNFRLAYS